MQAIQLSAKAGRWQLYAGRKADPAFAPFAKKVFERDNYTCQFCGFQAREYQAVVNLDQNYKNNKLSNLATACCFCAQCFFLEAVGAGDFGGGTLVYLPEISQGDLNSFCHVLFCAISNDTGYKGSAQTVYRSFKFRSQVIEDQFGEGSSSPAVFGQLMIDSEAAGKIVKADMLRDIRLLPSRAKFKKQIESWATAALDELSAEF